MRWARSMTLVEAHAEGEVGRVVVSGAPPIPGRTPLEKMRYLNEVDDALRRFLVFEPRGAAQMSTNLLLPPSREDADAAFIVLQGDRAHAMSGSNCICVVTVLLETGMIEMLEPETVVRLDTPAGLITARARCRAGKCESVTLEMPASFAEQLGVAVEIDGFGVVPVDIAFGGLFYALADVSHFGLDIVPSQARRLVDAGLAVQRAVNRQLDVRHPLLPALRGISYTMLCSRDRDGVLRGATVLPPGRIDRSPCGTGNAARLAVMVARGEARVGERLEARSIIDSRFRLCIDGETNVAGRSAILARVTGRGWVHGIHQLGVDPSDPWPRGYTLADCWGDGGDPDGS